MTGVLILGGALVVTVVIAVWWSKKNGAFSRSGVPHGLSAERIGHPLGQRATLVQFSSAFCSPCRATRAMLQIIAGEVEGVAYVDIDAESHLDLVRELDIVRTPTVLVLDAHGVVIERASGLPRKVDVIAALGRAIP